MAKELNQFAGTMSQETFDRALRGCENEPFLSPASIQPHGFLLTLDASQTIVQLSDNCQRWLNRSVDELLGKPLLPLLTEESQGRLMSLWEPARRGARHLPLVFTLDSGEIGFDARLHHSENLWLLELEPSVEDSFAIQGQAQQILADGGERLRRARDVRSMAQALVSEVRELTGFHQVMVYRFDADGHGTVIAEDRDGRMPSYLDQRFPATDVPYQVRRHMVRHPLRVSCDYLAEPSALIPAHHPLSGDGQDLSGCLLRTTHPWCVAFYRNMGVRATLVVAVVQEERLWGYLSCHHREARRPPASLRFTCLSLTQLFSALLSTKLLMEQMAEERRLLARLDQLLHRVNESEDWVTGLLADSSALLELVDAPGVALYTEAGCQTRGITPTPTEIHHLVGWLRDTGQSLFVTHKLSVEYPAGSSLGSTATGLLAVALGEGRERWLLWFRPEITHTVTWAGPPEHGLRQQGEGVALSSRSSFQQWVEQVQGTAKPFSAAELEAAVRLRVALYKRFLQVAEDQKRRIQARLEESQRWLSALMESLQEVVWTLSEGDGELLEISSPVAEITGYSVKDFLDRPGLWWEIIHPGDVARVRETLLAPGPSSPITFEYRINRADGVERWLWARARRMGSQGEQHGYLVGVAQDITDRQATEQRLKDALDAALAANQAKTTFLATMSHELRTPLNSVIGFSGILRDGLAGPVNDEQVRQLTMVHDSARHLLSLINEILDLSKIESGRYQVNARSFSLRGLLEHVHGLIAPQMQAKGISLALDCPAQIGEIHSDEGKLRQLLLNLLSNAQKFTHQGGDVTLRGRLAADWVCISVKDSGIGIASEQLEEIFQPFYQADSGDRRKFQGSGLGLAVCMRLAELLGGDLRVQSEPGVGSEFSVRLPLARGSGEHQWSPPGPG